jgi:hypothetical protein
LPELEVPTSELPPHAEIIAIRSNTVSNTLNRFIFFIA